MVCRPLATHDFPPKLLPKLLPKLQIPMKATSLILSSVLLATGAAHGVVYTLSGTMDPIQATTNPTNSGSGTGTIAGNYDDVTNLLDYTITWSDLTGTVTNMHFHVGAPGVAGGVDLGVPGPWSSPQTATGIALSAGQETNLLGGLWYLNIHTTEFGGGEIRGQVGVTPVPEPAVALLGALGLFGLARRRRA